MVNNLYNACLVQKEIEYDNFKDDADYQIMEQDRDYSNNENDNIDNDNIDNKHDKGFKYLLSAKKVFIELIRSFIDKGWVELIDEANVVKVDKSFIANDFKDKEADLIYRVKFCEQEVIFYLLVEMQSTVDFQMPYRLLLYMVELWRTVLKDSQLCQARKKDFKLPAVVPIVLYNGKNKWTACKSFREYLSGADIFGENTIDFKYILIDVNRYTEDELINMANLISSVFLIDQKQDIVSMMGRLKKIGETINCMSDQEFGMFKNWFGNVIIKSVNQESKSKFKDIIFKSREDKNMMVSNLEVLIKSELKKNKKEGIAQGLEKGIEKGIEKGRQDAILEVLSELGNVSNDVTNKIHLQKDISILSLWLKYAARSNNIEEFMSKIADN